MTLSSYNLYVWGLAIFVWLANIGLVGLVLGVSTSLILDVAKKVRVFKRARRWKKNMDKPCVVNVEEIPNM